MPLYAGYRARDVPGGNTTPGTYVRVWEYFYKVKGKPLRNVGRQNEPLYTVSSNEYRVALRVVTYKNGVSGKAYDYHFLVQTSSGAWADKMGAESSKLIGFVNPATYTWSDARNYDSDVIYFAVPK